MALLHEMGFDVLEGDRTLVQIAESQGTTLDTLRKEGKDSESLPVWPEVGGRLRVHLSNLPIY